MRLTEDNVYNAIAVVLIVAMTIGVSIIFVSALVDRRDEIESKQIEADKNKPYKEDFENCDSVNLIGLDLL